MRELAHLVGVVRHEQPHTELERVGDVLGSFDRVSVDATRWIDAEALHHLHLAGGGEIEEAALGQHGLDDRRVWHGLECVVQIHPRQRFLQLAELHAHALAVEDHQRRAELLDQAANFGGLERIDESRAAH